MKIIHTYIRKQQQSILSINGINYASISNNRCRFNFHDPFPTPHVMTLVEACTSWLRHHDHHIFHNKFFKKKQKNSHINEGNISFILKTPCNKRSSNSTSNHHYFFLLSRGIRHGSIPQCSIRKLNNTIPLSPKWSLHRYIQTKKIEKKGLW